MFYISLVMQILMMAFAGRHAEYRRDMMFNPKVNHSGLKYILVFYGHLLWILGIMFFMGASAYEEFKTIPYVEKPLGVAVYVAVCIGSIWVYVQIFKKWAELVIHDEENVARYFREHGYTPAQ